MKLEGRVALITGAGSGIGRAIALRFAEEGASVAVNDVVAEAAAKTVDAMGGARQRGFAIPADVSSSADVKAMFARVAERFGGLDILVNNAGVGEALKLMNARGRGAIINISSVAALHGIEIAPHYGAAKGGILSFTRSLAREVASRNIRVNAICPGFVETGMTAGFSPVLRAFSNAQIPMRRWGQPDEVAGTAAFLASDDSSYFTGQWLSPNGGMFTG